MTEQVKTVGEVFQDYEKQSNIKQTSILKINLFKKSNKLEIALFSQNYIRPDEILDFEQFLKERFFIDNIEINMQYEDSVAIPEISKQWKLIVKYMAHKYPFTEFLLHNSRVEVNQCLVTVSLSVKGADFLVARGFDKALEKTLKSLYKEAYKVTYVEDLQEEDMKKIEQSYKLTEKYEIEKAISEMVVEEDEIVEAQDDLPREELETSSINVQENKEEKTPLILGRNANIKESIIKISEISIDSGKVAIEGEILNVSSRTLKSGKILILFDVYDGTSTITCKAFVEEEKANSIITRLKQTKAIRLSGTARI
ncbi:MAG: hypothetical protein HFJ27_03945 [Clostridia bacterium]|nr:hypothetical protein [Clostridia bacterium]